MAAMHLNEPMCVADNLKSYSLFLFAYLWLLQYLSVFRFVYKTKRLPTFCAVAIFERMSQGNLRISADGYVENLFLFDKRKVPSLKEMAAVTSKHV